MKDFYRLYLCKHFVHVVIIFAGAFSIGVNYGLNGNNLPPPTEVLSLYERCHIKMLRLFEPRPEVLQASRGSTVVVSLGTRNEDIQSIATDQEAANSWINTNVVPYMKDVNIGYITIGNEVIPGPLTHYVAKAIENTYTALSNAGITKDIKVTTVIPFTALSISYPPSAGMFNDDVSAAMSDISFVLRQHSASIMINVYPYFAYASDPKHISLDYALFKSNGTVVMDGNLGYNNLFDAMVDSMYAAFEKIGDSSVVIDISETGWPSAGNEPYTTIENAQTYNKNLIDHVISGKGTPRRPNQIFNTFIFEMFNENLKSAGVEQNFGFFTPTMYPIYPFWQC